LKGTGQDDPETSKNDIMGQGRRWIEAVGGVVEDEGVDTGVEVSPLISYVSIIIILDASNSVREVKDSST
jgi:hypothetical protein